MFSRRIACLLVGLAAAANVATASAATIEIKMQNLAFVPAEVHASVGDTIKWVNQDFLAHTATARNGDWDVVIGPHKTADLVLKNSGTLDYYCRFHPNMTGRIVVTAGGAPQ